MKARVSMRLAWVIVDVAALFLIEASQGLNPCLDPASSSFVCAPGTDEIDIEGCGVTEDDAEDLAACLTVARRAGVNNFKDEDRQPTFASGAAYERSLQDIEVSTTTFLQLATERFDARTAASGLQAEANWTFDHHQVQLVRVPKAGSSEASVLARLLGGCHPRGPCCRFPGDPPGSCPAKGLMCPAVVGCAGHGMGHEAKASLREPSVFSMSNLRDVVDRLVSGFFYTAPHSPECARRETVDYEQCFLEMTQAPKFQNVASKMISGHYAYDAKKRLCLQDDQEGCSETLESVLHGACDLNFITMCETWQSSVLLLFETLPWVQPTKEFFPVPRHEKGDGGAKEIVASRHNDGARHEEGIKHITPELRNVARDANSVDFALHEFVSAKFCDRLEEMGVLDHPLVVAELAGYDTLNQRCMDRNWLTSTLERFKPLLPEECRLYRPLAHP